MCKESEWQHIRGVGIVSRQKLHALGIDRPCHLLTHLPIRYEDRTRLTSLAEVVPGHGVLIQAQVSHVKKRVGRRSTLTVAVSDPSGTATLRFFHFNQRLMNLFSEGKWLRCYGEARLGPHGLELVHPDLEFLTPENQELIPDYLTAVYPTVAGLSQKRLRNWIDQALTAFNAGRLGGYQLRAEGLVAPLFDALTQVHRPPPGSMELVERRVELARRRLARDELLAQYLASRYAFHEQRLSAAECLRSGDDLAARLREQLDFELTGAQQRADEEIAGGLAKASPLRCLLQGDVGSGKTVVAALAAARAIGSGYQAALMAPTELLAHQHLRTLSKWFAMVGCQVLELTSSTPRKEREEIACRLSSGEPLFVVGTHALISEGMQVPRLALAIIDEQHRFGVSQRLALAGSGVHQLVMTATPIPRTLAMTLYADLDLCVLDEVPPGRQPVDTALVSETRRSELIRRLGREIRLGRQAYWVCPLIEESESLAIGAAEVAAKELAMLLAPIRVGLVHGRLSSLEKDQVMEQFSVGELDILVATTVIEVGVDVPNASLMVIENAERLGLAQLHQLRGRVGRGPRKSHCVLLYQGPLTTRARTRLETLRQTHDGFKIAEQDLLLRGPGEYMGTRQAGFAKLRVADFARDQDLLECAPQVGDHLVQKEPEQAQRLMEFWIEADRSYANA